MTRLYIAGPMTGIPQFNIPLFDAAASALRERGYEVISPAELDDPEDRAAALGSVDGSALHYGSDALRRQTWGDFLARDVKLLVDDGIEAVVVLPGWEGSRGARLETFVASALCQLPVLRLRWNATVGVMLDPMPSLDLYRAWCSEPTLAIRPRPFVKVAV